MSSEDLKIIQAETEILRDFPPVAKQSDIQSVCHEVLLSGSRAISYFNNLVKLLVRIAENLTLNSLFEMNNEWYLFGMKFMSSVSK